MKIEMNRNYEKLLFIMHKACSELRYFEDRQQMADLADAIELIPAEMLCWQDHSQELIQAALQSYQSKYCGAWDYLAILAMDEEVFLTRYLLRSCSNEEQEEAVSCHVESAR